MRQIDGAHPATSFRLAGIEQRAHLGRERRVLTALGVNAVRPHFIGSRESLVEDRFNPQKAFRHLVHLSDNPVRNSPCKPNIRLREPESN